MRFMRYIKCIVDCKLRIRKNKYDYYSYLESPFGMREWSSKGWLIALDNHATNSRISFIEAAA